MEITSKVVSDLKYMLRVSQYILKTDKYDSWDNLREGAALTEEMCSRLINEGYRFISDKQRELLNKKVVDFYTVFEHIKEEKLNRRMNKLYVTPKELRPQLQNWFRKNPVKVHRPKF